MLTDAKQFLEASDLWAVMTPDLLVVTVCAVVLARTRQFSFAHPACLYLAYHVYSVTYRLWSLIQGAPTMYQDNIAGIREVISIAEIARASVLCDVALVLFVVGSCAAGWVAGPRRSGPRSSKVLASSRMLDRRLVFMVAGFAFVLGSLVFLKVRIGSASSGNWLFLMTMWPVTALLIFIYFDGFKPVYLAPLLLYLGVVGLQGFHRTMLIMPVLNLAVIWQFRQRRRWPPARIMIVLLTLLALFPALKEIGGAFQKGETGSMKRLAMESLESSLSLAPEGSRSFLDQFACSLTLVDRRQELYYGRYYAALPVYWVPRAWWPNKPRINQPLIDLSTRMRPIAEEGRVPTLLGDAYLNFGQLGLVVYPLVIAFFLTWWYIGALNAPHRTLSRLFYVTVFATFIQLFRDGVPSLPMFGLAWNMPMIGVALAHWYVMSQRAAPNGAGRRA